MHQILELYNFINHFGNEQGMKYEVIKPGEIVYTMTVQDRHASGPGVAHGGLVAGFMDAVLGVAALSLSVEDGMLVSTIEFKINFFQPVRIGQVITGKGKVDSKGNRIVTASGEIFDTEGNLLAKGMGTFNCYPAEKIKGKIDAMFGNQ